MKAIIKTTLALLGISIASSFLSSCGNGETGSRFFGNPKTQSTTTSEKKPGGL
jgi:hypothetical protein